MVIIIWYRIIKMNVKRTHSKIILIKIIIHDGERSNKVSLSNEGVAKINCKSLISLQWTNKKYNYSERDIENSAYKIKIELLKF